MNIDQLRKQTPGCDHVIHLNNAGASLVSKRTLTAQTNYLNEEAKFGGYEMAIKYAEVLARGYNDVAQLINASPSEIAFTESATVAWLRAILSIPFQPGDIIICDYTSYASNYIAYLNLKKKFGIRIKVIGPYSTGEIDIQSLESSITANTKLISLTHMPTNGGLVNPAERIGEIAAQHGILYLLDACQSIGQYPIDIKAIQCDWLSATGRKYLRGPRGTGFLYVNKDRIEAMQPLNLDLHSATWVSEDQFTSRNDARVYETWEANLSARIGMIEAVQQVNELGIDIIWHRIQDLSKYLRDLLSEVKGIMVTDIGGVKSGIVTFYTERRSSKVVQQLLHDKNINTSLVEKNGTLLDMSHRKLEAMIRASVHYYNTKREVEEFVKILTRIIQ